MPLHVDANRNGEGAGTRRALPKALFIQTRGKSQSGTWASGRWCVSCDTACSGNVTSTGGLGGISEGGWSRAVPVGSDANGNQSGSCDAMCSAAAAMWSAAASGIVTSAGIAGKWLGKCSTAWAWSGRLVGRAMLVLRFASAPKGGILAEGPSRLCRTYLDAHLDGNHTILQWPGTWHGPRSRRWR